MNKKELISIFITSFGLTLIFKIASKSWLGGIIVGLVYFTCLTIVTIRRNKNK